MIKVLTGPSVTHDVLSDTQLLLVPPAHKLRV